MPAIHKCSCGFGETDKVKFARHFASIPADEKAGHKSMGAFDTESGEKLRGNVAEQVQAANAGAAVRPDNAKQQPVSNPPKFPTGGATPGKIITIVPRAATIDSTLLWQAKTAAINELGWDPNMSDSDFIDTWLHWSFGALKPKAIILGGYGVREEEADAANGNGHNGNGHNGNGHRTFSEDEVKAIAERAVKEAVALVAGGKN